MGVGVYGRQRASQNFRALFFKLVLQIYKWFRGTKTQGTPSQISPTKRMGAQYVEQFRDTNPLIIPPMAMGERGHNVIQNLGARILL